MMQMHDSWVDKTHDVTCLQAWYKGDCCHGEAWSEWCAHPGGGEGDVQVQVLVFLIS